MAAELIVLRLVHVLSGAFWVGSGLFTALFLAPALKSSGINPGPLFAAFGKRKLFIVLPTAALLTFASGLRLTWIVSGGFSSAWVGSAPGRTYLLSGAASVVAFFLSLLIGRPLSVRGGQLAAAAARAAEPERTRLSAESAALQRRGGIASSVAVTLLGLAAAGMAVARYL